MFSGIVEAVGEIISLASIEGGEGRRMVLGVPRSIARDVGIGDSLAINGVCCTVIGKIRGAYRLGSRDNGMSGGRYRRLCFELGVATLGKTTAASWEQGMVVNIERALPVSARINGHLVQGHVGGVGTVTGVESIGEQLLLSVRLPQVFRGEILLEGSIALDGVSLTIAKLHGLTITCSLLPYTVNHTTLNTLKRGDRMNIESDFMLRYLKHHARRNSRQ